MSLTALQTGPQIKRLSNFLSRSGQAIYDGAVLRPVVKASLALTSLMSVFGGAQAQAQASELSRILAEIERLRAEAETAAIAALPGIRDAIERAMAEKAVAEAEAMRVAGEAAYAAARAWEAALAPSKKSSAYIDGALATSQAALATLDGTVFASSARVAVASQRTANSILYAAGAIGVILGLAGIYTVWKHHKDGEMARGEATTGWWMLGIGGLCTIPAIVSMVVPNLLFNGGV